MGVFEIQSGGKTFEVEAPDMQSAAKAVRKNYSVSEIPGAIVENAGENAEDIVRGLTNRYEEVGAGGLVKDVLRTAAGVGQKVVRGAAGEVGLGPEIGTPQYQPGRYEKFADPMLQTMLQDWGWNEPTLGAQWEQIKRNVAEKPVTAGLDASAVMAPGAGIPGRVGRGLTAASRAVNPLAWAGRGVTTVAKRAITPFPARQGALEAANALQAEGVHVTAGQRTGRKGLKYAESEIGGGATQNIIDAQLEDYTLAASRRIGEETRHLDAAALRNARARIGNDFNTVGLRNTIPPDPQLATDVTRGVQQYVHSVPVPVPGVQAIGRAIVQRAGGRIGGRTYTQFRSRLARLSRNTKDPELKTVYGDMREALDDAMERSMSPADVEIFRNARQQYRNYIVLENAMATGGEATAMGLLTPAKLEAAAAAGPNRSWYARGLSDFSELAKEGKAGLTPMPESGTVGRTATRAVPIAGGMVLGGLMGGGGTDLATAAGAALGGMGAQVAAGRALMSAPVQRYLGNQVLGNSATGRAVDAAGRVAGVGGRMASPVLARTEALSNAQQVLSPDVLDHIKRSENTRAPLNQWLKARASGEDVEGATRQLAEAIVTELKIDDPDIVERIVSELSQARGP